MLSSQFGATPADESLSSIRSSTVLGTSTPIAAANMTSSVALVSASKSARKFKNTHTTKSRKRTKQTPLDVNVMTEAKANLHIMSQVQVVLSEGLDLGFLLRCVRYIVNVYLILLYSFGKQLMLLPPISHIDRPMYQASLIQMNPGIELFLPRSLETIMRNYVLKADLQLTIELTKLMKESPGGLSVSFDGVTVNKRSKNLVCVSIGGISMFYKYFDLRDKDHVTTVEVCWSPQLFSMTSLLLTSHQINKVYELCKELKALFGRNICSVPSDNAALPVSKGVVQKLLLDGEATLVTRDPCHCIDLGSKDLAKIPCVESVLKEAVEVHDFMVRPRVDAMRDTLISEEDAEAVEHVKKGAGKLDAKIPIIHKLSMHLT